MGNVIYQADLDHSINLLNKCLYKQAPTNSLHWIEKKQDQILKEKSNSLYFMTFSAISSYFSNEILSLTDNELKEASTIRKHWRPVNWSLAQVARTSLVLSFARYRPEHFIETLNKLFSAADLHELITLYQSFQLFPNPDQLLLHATNGIRSNMTTVFEAMALNNPYPADYFDELAWNQLVLKTLFVDSPIQNVIGLKRRANPALASALINTACERFAANRPIKQELWCLIGMSIDKETWPSLKKLSSDENPVLQQGVLLACDHCQLVEAQELFKKSTERYKDIQQYLNQLRIFKQELI